MSNRKILYIGIGLIVVIMISLMVFPKKEKADITIVTPPSIIATLPHWISIEKGFYEDENLNIETKNFSGSDLMIKALSRGDADILPAVSLLDLINHSKNETEKPILYSHSRMALEPPFEALVTLKKSGINTIKDLNGKKIAVYPGLTSKEVVKHYLKKQGLNVDEMKFYPLSPAEHLKMLESGEIQAAHIYEPYKSRLLLNGNTKLLSNSIYASYNEPSGIGISAISNKFKNTHSDLVEKYFKTWNKSIDFIRKNPKESREILKKYLNLSKAESDSAVWVDATRTDEISKFTLLETINSLQEIGLIDNDFVLTEEYILTK